MDNQSRSVTLHVASPAGEFYKRLAAFAYAGYLRHGFGAVLLIGSQFRQCEDGSIEASLIYVPYSDPGCSLPLEMVKAPAEYDPTKECVLVIADQKGHDTVLTLTEHEIGSTPAQLLQKQWLDSVGIAFAPGRLLRIAHPIDDLKSGYCMFLYLDGTEMVLARAEQELSEDIAVSGEEFRVHVDYRDVFEDTEGNFFEG